MNVHEQSSDSADGATTAYTRSAGLAILALAAAAVGLAACGGSSPPTVASLAKSTVTTGSSTADGGPPAAKLAKGDPTRLVDEWAACARSHGDPNQADPTIDVHGVINITVPPIGEGRPVGGPHAVKDVCSDYLAAAQRDLRAAIPVRDPGGDTNPADQLRYVNCMRASGVPNYPYPTGDSTDFNGTGVDPTNPSVVRISISCGNKLGLPLWWSAGWGPPGDVTVSPAIAPGGPAPGPLVPATGASHGGPHTRPPVSVPGGPSGANG